MSVTVQIGTTVWDQHTGTVTPSAGTSVREEVQADGSIKLFPQAKRDESRGALVTTKLVASERAAVALNVLASSLIDSRVSIGLPGIVLAGVRVQAVDVRHVKQRYRDGEEWLVTAAWQFGPSENDDGDPRELYVTTKVETCRNYGEWVEQADLICTSLVETAGDSPGAAAFIQTLDPDDEDAEPLDVAGLYVRVWLPVGDDLVRPDSFAVAWTGKIKIRSMGSDGNRVNVLFAAVDLTDEWDTYLDYWYERKSEGLIVDPGDMPAFNALPGGDRSTDGGGPFATEVHDRIVTPGTPWRASHIVDTLLAALRDQFDGGATWVLGGQRTALDNFQACDLDGRSLREQLGQLMGRGLGFTVSPNDEGRDVLLNIHSPLRTSITAAGWTIPASTSQRTVDLVAMTDRSGWNSSENWGRVMDRTVIQAGRRWDCITLGIAGDDTQELLKDYTAGEATTWDAATSDSRNGVLAHVHRRFRLSPTWVGGTFADGAAVLPMLRTRATDALHGVNGEAGGFQAGGTFIAQNIRFTKALPFTAGRDWTSPSSETLIATEPLERPFVAIVDGSTWSLLDMEVTVDADAPVITIGRDATDAATIKALLAAGKILAVTLGFLYPLPWRHSWHRDPDEQRSDRAREIVYQRPDIEWRYMHEGTVTGVANGAAQEAVAGDIGPKPDTIEQLLGLALLSHQEPFRDLTYTRAGVLDLSADTKPGVLITDATLPFGPPEGTVVTIDGLIAARAWNLDRSRPATTTSCARRPVDIVQSPVQQPARPISAAQLAALAYGG